MRNRFFGVLYAINIVSQAIFSLIAPAAFMFGISWLLVKKAGAPEWIYAITITLGIITGFISMVRFVLSATAGLERLEKQRKNNSKSGHNNNG